MWSRLSVSNLAPHMDEGKLLPGRYSALNTFPSHIHTSLLFPEEKNLKRFCCFQNTTASSFHLQRSFRPRKTTKELTEMGFPSHLLLHQEILPLGMLVSQ